MALYRYRCPRCNLVVKSLTPPKEKPTHKACGTVLEHDAQAPAMHHKEVIDNGAMTRRVERFVDAQALAHERAGKNYRKPE